MEKFEFLTPAIGREDLEIYDVQQAPFRLYGLYKPEEGQYRRMPREVARRVSDRVLGLHANTAGARVRFATDSLRLAVCALYPEQIYPSDRSAALSGAGAFFFDLYADGEHMRVLWHETVKTAGNAYFDLSNGRYESHMSFPTKKMRQITLCFPAFVNVSRVLVGLDRGAAVEEGAAYQNQDPVVFYGSSITQGACASRAGNSYPNLLSRWLNFDYVNLGFAGGCGAEGEIIDYLCALKTPLLVYDYDHNCTSLDHLRKTHLPGLEKLRRAHPEIPFVLLSKPNRHAGKEEAVARMRIIEESYLALQKMSMAPVHFVSGQEIFESYDPEMMTVDGTHPTDLGFYAMAKALLPVFKKYF